MLGLGECHPGYNPKVHGPYDPAINYGKSKLSSVLTCFIKIIVYDLYLRKRTTPWIWINILTFFSEDIPLGQVKISELPGWLARRNWTPAGIARGMSRGYWRWNHAFLQPKRAGMAGFIHWCVGICFVSYMASYGKFRKFLSTFQKNDFT